MELLSVFSGLWLAAALIVRRDMDARAQGTVLTLSMAAAGCCPCARAARDPGGIAAFFGQPRLTGIVALLAAILLISGVSWFYETCSSASSRSAGGSSCQVVRTARLLGDARSRSPRCGAGVWSLVFGYLAGHSRTRSRCWCSRLAGYGRRSTCARRGGSSAAGAASLGRTWRLHGQNADYLAVGRLLGPSQLGFYAMAYRQASCPTRRSPSR